MKIFGLTILPTKALNGLIGDRWWWPIVRESSAGAWQKNIEIRVEDALSYWPVFRCVELISSDIAKLGLDLVDEDPPGVYTQVRNPAFSPVLRKPNRYQTRIQFFENWLQSKLIRGNTYVLKQRDQRGVVTAMYVLDPALVKPLVSDDGSVFYQLDRDNLSAIEESVVAPASEIIHDRWNTFYHPLCGLSPIYAAAPNILIGKRIERSSSNFFENGARPSGILTAPATIPDDLAKRLKEHWEQNYSGDNSGKIAVLGDGLKFDAMTMTAEDAQLIDRLKWTAETICGVFGVPKYMVLGDQPNYNNVQALQIQYYSQRLQILIEAIEALLDEGLGLNKAPGRLGTRFDLNDLLRMDTATQFDVLAKAKGTLTLDETRRRVGYAPVEGGDTIYLQQQDHSLAAIAARDAMLIDQSENPPEPEPPVEDGAGEAGDDDQELSAANIVYAKGATFRCLGLPPHASAAVAVHASV